MCGIQREDLFDLFITVHYFFQSKKIMIEKATVKITFIFIFSMKHITALIGLIEARFILIKNQIRLVNIRDVNKIPTKLKI